jgi:hypothetical protein
VIAQKYAENMNLQEIGSQSKHGYNRSILIEKGSGMGIGVSGHKLVQTVRGPLHRGTPHRRK